jgi:RNA-directed DNA polymerase
MNLAAPSSVQKLQTALHDKAKESPKRRFHALYDKVYRRDVLAFAYECCKANGGAAGVDGQSFEDIEEYGVERWLDELAEELKSRTYRPRPVRRVYIPKPDGKQRPLGVPTIRDRTVETAAVLVLEPIYEADLQPEQYAYRQNHSALDAVRHVHKLINTGHGEIVDADLSGYLDTYTQCSYGYSNRSGAGSTTLIRKPLRCPWRIWRASSSPRFTRCQMVWRETPSRLLASTTDT